MPAWWRPPHIPTQQKRRPHLNITISAETLAEIDDLPGELAGYGAITAQTARDLAKHCGTANLIVHGRRSPAPAALSADAAAATSATDAFSASAEAGYRPSAALIREVIAFHRTCRFPGCPRAAE